MGKLPILPKSQAGASGNRRAFCVVPLPGLHAQTRSSPLPRLQPPDQRIVSHGIQTALRLCRVGLAICSSLPKPNGAQAHARRLTLQDRDDQR
jgi:hypothetical protein